MSTRKVLLFGLMAIAEAAQPSAPSPVSAPLRDLPWGQLNFLHTTDTHGWLAGHLQEPSYSADWGDYISFAHHLKKKAEEDGRDLLLIDTGDRVEGNGLYDASSPTGKYTRQIFAEQDVDLICSGNHELYKRDTSEIELLEVVPSFKDSYIASNLDIQDPESGEWVPLAPRVRKLTTKIHKIRITAFGFIFNFEANDQNTRVQKVEDTIQEQWFQEAIRDRETDLFVVIGHVPASSVEYTNLYKAIRDVQWDAPIVFFAGHTHIRDYVKYDATAFALESGRYMETIGFQSISGIPNHKDKSNPEIMAAQSFARRYIDNNLYSLYYHSGKDDESFPTEHGKNVSAMIASARKSMDLDSKIGCAPKTLWTNRAPFLSEDSLFSWLRDQVIPDITKDIEPDRPKIVIANTGAMRFDIFEGPFTNDTTYIVSPFTSVFRIIRDVPYDIADRILTVLNSVDKILEQLGPAYDTSELASPRAQRTRETVLVSGMEFATPFALENMQTPLFDSTLKSRDGDNDDSDKEKPKLTPGYTTKDDAGDDGDDTEHSSITFYQVPNCIEARLWEAQTSETHPERVDVVYFDFIQPFVLAAMKFLGGDYNETMTEGYLDNQTFTNLMVDWIRSNWDGEC